MKTSTAMDVQPAIRATYRLTRYEIVAPAVTNAGEPSGYPEALADALDAAGFGWTAHDTLGSWQGLREPGREFVVYANAGLSSTFARIARAIMPDQDAVQVVEHVHSVLLREA